MVNWESAEQTVMRAEGGMVSDMNGEKVMFSVSSGKYYNLGAVGGRIWELIASPITIDRLVDELTLEYDIERAVCKEQVAAFLQRLREEALVEVRSLDA